MLTSGIIRISPRCGREPAGSRVALILLWLDRKQLNFSARNPFRLLVSVLRESVYVSRTRGTLARLHGGEK